MPSGLDLNLPQPGLNLMDQAKQQYPILKDLGLNFKYNPQMGGQSGMLEFWPGDEQGTPKTPRPKEFPIGSLGVEVFDKKTRPIDILGDVVSHHLVNSDPTVKDYYNQFKQSLTPDQKTRLQSQYQWAQKNYGETRPYQQWEEHSGMPAYFRGYPFQQWDDAASAYTPEQLLMLDEMMKYLKGGGGK